MMVVEEAEFMVVNNFEVSFEEMHMCHLSFGDMYDWEQNM